MKLDLMSQKGKKVGKIDLSEEVFAGEINSKLLAQAIRVYQANRRQGTSSTKSRGEVRGSGRKIWRQKGTGRARHGDRYAPIFVGGGRAHGPQPKDWSFSLPKKMRCQALVSSLRAKRDKLVVVDRLEFTQPKTKEFRKFLLATLPEEARSVLVVIPELDQNVYLSARNLPNVLVLPVNQINALEVMRVEWLIVLQEALFRLMDRLSGLRVFKTEEEIIPLEELGLKKRVLSALQRAGMQSFSDLEGKSEGELQEIKGIGPQAAKQIKEKLVESRK
jgi:large subunit ribosomal protein L4